MESCRSISEGQTRFLPQNGQSVAHPPAVHKFVMPVDRRRVNLCTQRSWDVATTETNFVPSVNALWPPIHDICMIKLFWVGIHAVWEIDYRHWHLKE